MTSRMMTRLSFGLALALWAGSAGAADPGAQGGAPPAGNAASIKAPEPGLHGGRLATTKGHVFETVFAPDGVRIYTYATSEAPAMTRDTDGKVTFELKTGSNKDVPLARKVPKEGEPTVYFCPMHSQVVQTEPGICKLCGGMKLFTQDYLFAPYDLSKTAPKDVKVLVTLSKLEGEEATASFTETFHGFPKGAATQAKS